MLTAYTLCPLTNTFLSMINKDIRILLHNIRSVHNVGAIFRTADAIGVSKIYLTGYSPTPIDRFGNRRSDFAKCSLGSEMSIAWEQLEDPKKIISSLKKEGFKVVVIEQSRDSLDYKEAASGIKNGSFGEKFLIIFGNEVEGVDKGMIKKADIVAEIPMRGIKESLNVSVSAGIILFALFDN